MATDESRLSVEQLAEIASVKKERSKVGTLIKRLEADFWSERTPAEQSKLGEELPRLFRAREALGAEGERQVVLNLLRDDLAMKMSGHSARKMHELISVYMLWVEKYSVSLREIQNVREQAAGRVEGFLKDAGYVD